MAPDAAENVDVEGIGATGGASVAVGIRLAPIWFLVCFSLLRRGFAQITFDFSQFVIYNGKNMFRFWL